MNYQLTVVPNTAANYKFDRWGGSVSGSANPISVSVSDGAKNVTAYFKLKTEPVSLEEAKSLLDGNKDMLVLDVSSATNYAGSHMLCAKNYIWNSHSNSFSTSIKGLSLYKDDDILVYDQNGSLGENAADYLAGQGFNSIYYMTDGLNDWMAEGYETFASAEDSGKCTSLAPMAYAGADQNVNENATVTLRGQGADPDGGAVTFLWNQIEGSTVSLSSDKTSQPTFRAPDLNGGNDTLIFHLTVTDNKGDKDTDSVKVNVKWNNAQPQADAGLDQTVTFGQTVTLDGSGSTDPEGSMVSYQWDASGGVGTFPASLSGVTPSFITPDKEGWVIYTLTVTDNGGLSDTDMIRIRVEEGANNVPIANAGADRIVASGQTITLDSSGSADSDGTITSRVWTQTTGTRKITLSSKTAIKPTFVAPSVSSPEVFTFSLTVIDNEDSISIDTIQITVNEKKDVPVCDIKANGLDGPVNINSTDNLSLTIELMPGEFVSENADWWLVAATPFGIFHFQTVDFSWAPNLTYGHKGPLFCLGELEVLNISGLPAGSYTVYFGFDMIMNGLLDMGQAYYDFVTINIQ